MKGVFVTAASISDCPPGPGSRRYGAAIVKLVKSTKHSVDAYVPVPGLAKLQVALVGGVRCHSG